MEMTGLKAMSGIADGMQKLKASLSIRSLFGGDKSGDPRSGTGIGVAGYALSLVPAVEGEGR